MGYAPQALYDCYDTIHQSIPDAINAGIYGPQPGYHGSRNDQDPSDYSVQLPEDQQGDPDAGAALDVTMYDDADMKACTQRLIDATWARDERLRGLRSFFGTVDGYTVTGMDVPGCYWVTSDPSHLFHVHLSGLRKYANDRAAWQDIAAVFTGAGTTEGEDMPTLIRVTASKDQPLVKGESAVVKFDEAPTDPEGVWGGGAGLRLAGKVYVSTLELTIDVLGKDESVSVALQTVTEDDKSSTPRSEFRGTTGTTAVTHTRAGRVAGAAKWIQTTVAPSQDCKLTAANWIVLYW
jgi:hypothetical protein